MAAPPPQWVEFARRGGSERLTRVTFSSAHDYASNARTVRMWTATPKGELALWAELALERRAGAQSFALPPLPRSVRRLRVEIAANFGDDTTYLSRLFFAAEPRTLASSAPPATARDAQLAALAATEAALAAAEAERARLAAALAAAAPARLRRLQRRFGLPQ